MWVYRMPIIFEAITVLCIMLFDMRPSLMQVLKDKSMRPNAIKQIKRIYAVNTDAEAEKIIESLGMSDDNDDVVSVSDTTSMVDAYFGKRDRQASCIAIAIGIF